ncbi:ABC transporter ATP-binding protein [Marinococcus sp. PL1-022]|uniref:ABC transporter ATP-binding protein n=1 Tax=Marinococcus sp. PL1-022 TaxID=3095363 RepID=UPI0029C418CD|nr:ATP-binding cassette domain-containing protein [Marinococcus sp. PL1-022]MDX6152785.1 ATP-binding cassette domain-containing protein [Marinococcus sp. PL1-022]
MSAIIEAVNVHFKYPGASDYVLNGADFSIEQGEFTAVIGGNGSGKTTLCKTINGLIPNYYTGAFSGEIRVGTKSVSQTTVSEMSHAVGYVYQDFENQLMRPTVLDDVAFAPLNFGDPAFMKKAEWALEALGISHLRDQSIWQLSGGQKHLTAIAGVLALDPEILIIDEPAAQLDPHHARDIYSRLQKLQNDYGKTIIVIEHHTEFIADFCSRVLLVDHGRVLWNLPVKEGLLQIHDLTSRDIFPPQVTQAALNMNSGPEHDFPVTVAEGYTYFKQNVHPPALSAGPKEKAAGEELPLMTLNRLSFSAKTMANERKNILNNLSASFYPGEKIALVGTNGAGKTTLMKCFAGMIKPTEGSWDIHADSVKKKSLEQLAGVVSYIFQNPEEMFIQDSVYNDLYFHHRSRGQSDDAFIEQLIQSFRLEDVLDKDGRLLSGGQQRRASMAVGLASEPRLLMLDEPTASLDVQSRKELVRILQQMNKVDTVLIATHDMQLVAEWANRVIVMDRGEFIFDGLPRDMFDQEYIWKRAGLVPPQIVQLALELDIEPPPLSVEEFTNWIKEEITHGVS